MTRVDEAAIGRPLRLLLLLGLGLAVWIMLRLPILQRDIDGTKARERPDTPPDGLQLVSATAADGPNALAIAEAEVGVARARLALAEAQLQLVRAQRGGGYVPPAPAYPPPPYAAAPPAYAAVPMIAPVAPRRRPGPASDAPIPDYAYAMPVADRPRAGATPVAQAEAASAPAPDASPGHALATRAYARLAAGDRRGAVELFDAALSTPPAPGDDADRLRWTAERRRLAKRWSGEVYSLFRNGGAVGPTASPVLGGGQSGIVLGWTPNPLARRPLALVARFNTANDPRGSPDNRTSQAAIGVRWQVANGISVTGERLVRVGAFARNDWNLRAAAGADGRRGRIDWTIYGEAGVLGAGDVYAGAQARATTPLLHLPKTAVAAGAGSWGSVQNSAGYALGRFDIGPTLVLRTAVGRTTFDLSADWRFRVAGGALPGSGPAVTLSTGF